VRNNRLAKRFIRYHLANPGMWGAYEALALETVRSGRKSTGCKALAEQLRWLDDGLADQCRHTPIGVAEEGEGFKITNDFTSFYARMFAHVHPEHEDLFRYKRSAADYINYTKLMRGDAKGALNWVDPQREFDLEHYS